MNGKGMMAIGAAVIALIGFAGEAKTERVLFASDFEDGAQPQRKEYSIAKGKGRKGSTAWVVELPAGTNLPRRSYRWQIPALKMGMKFRAEVWVRATTNSTVLGECANIGFDVVWNGKGYYRDVHEKIDWLHHTKGKGRRYEVDDEGWARMELELTTPIAGDICSVPELCFGVRPHCEKTAGGTVWIDDIAIYETGRVWTDAIATSAYRDEAAEGPVTIKAAHFIDAASLKDGLATCAFIRRTADGRTVEVAPSEIGTDVAAVTVDAKEFPLGESEVAFVVRDRAGKELGRSTRTFTRTSEARQRRVWIDRFGRTWVNGKLFFPIGMFNHSRSLLNPEFAARYIEPGVFNFAQVYDFDDPEIAKERLDYYQSLGLMVVLSVKDHYQKTLPACAPRGIKTFEDGQRLTEQVVTASRNHPAVLGWMTCDETPAHNAKYLVAKYELIKKLDPDHPVHVCVADGNSLRAFVNACDSFGTDCYPVVGEPPDQGPAASTGAVLARARESAMGLRAMWQVPQVYSPRWECGRHAWKRPEIARLRMPTFLEFRSMVWQQIAVGANAIMMYSYGCLAGNEWGLPDFERDYNIVCSVAREAKRFADVILREPGPVLFDKNDGRLRIRTWKGDRENELYVLIVNPSFPEQSGEIPLPPGQWKIADSLIPSQGIKCVQGKLKLALEPWDIGLLKLTR